MNRARLAIITGTSSGIGAALARRLLADDWDVVGIARRAAKSSSSRYHHIAVDLQDIDETTRRLDQRLAPVLRDTAWTRVGLVNNAAGAGALAQIERIDPAELVRLYAVNVAAPIWLMGFVVRESPAAAALRIVNVSSGAAVRPFGGLGAYGSSKAALRMAGMILAEELASPLRRGTARNDAAVLSYEPGTVDTPMQANARSQPAEDFPWVGLFRGFAERGALVSPDTPAAEIADFLESDAAPPFSERRLGQQPASVG